MNICLEPTEGEPINCELALPGALSVGKRCTRTVSYYRCVELYEYHSSPLRTYGTKELASELSLCSSN